MQNIYRTNTGPERRNKNAEMAFYLSANIGQKNSLGLVPAFIPHQYRGDI